MGSKIITKPGKAKLLVLLLVLLFAVYGKDLTALMLRNLASITIARGKVNGNAGQIQEGYILAMRSTEFMDGPDSARRLAGYAKLQLGQPTEAIAILVPLASASPADRLADFWLGVAYEQVGQRDEATRAWMAAGRTDKVIEMANNLKQTGDATGALREYDRILAVAPDLIAALAGKGEIALAKEDWANVSSLYSAVLKQNPNDPQALVALGVATWHVKGDAHTSLQLIEQAISSTPKCTWCYLNLAEIAAESGDVEAAHAALAEAERLTKVDALMAAR